VLNSSISYYSLKNCLCFLSLLIGSNQFAQNGLLDSAQKLCLEKKYDLAIPIIDKVILDPETKLNAGSWSIRAIAYFQSYKSIGKYDVSKISLIDTALSSTYISMKLDITNDRLESNKILVKSIAGVYYNLSSVLLKDSLNSVLSEKYYLRYKKMTTQLNPSFDFKEKDIEYYRSLGSIFLDLYMQKNFNQEFGEIAKTSLIKVLDINPKDISANINLGVFYYNQGATLMRLSDYTTDLVQLGLVQDNALKLFKQAEPFMLRVHVADPKEITAIEGLEGIYVALLDEVKANEFKIKKEALIKKQ